MFKIDLLPESAITRLKKLPADGKTFIDPLTGALVKMFSATYDYDGPNWANIGRRKDDAYIDTGARFLQPTVDHGEVGSATEPLDNPTQFATEDTAAIVAGLMRSWLPNCTVKVVNQPTQGKFSLPMVNIEVQELGRKAVVNAGLVVTRLAATIRETAAAVSFYRGGIFSYDITPDIVTGIVNDITAQFSVNG